VLCLLAALAACELVDEGGDLEELPPPEVPTIATCSLGARGVYSPYAESGRYPSGKVSSLPWRGSSGSYPSGVEDFRGYTLPTTVECSSDKDRRDHLEVTSGCLSAVAVGDYSRGRIKGVFRALALGHAAGTPELPAKWTDQATEYRFYHRGRTGTIDNPGFKAFVRYRSEDDLYVASWRFDGVVQIQKKQCGSYTALATVARKAPTAEAWHTIKFAAEGAVLTLWLDDAQVLSVRDATFSWGTAGIRIDEADGTYLDDWRVFAP
jgi:hypothetical protein